MFLQKTAFILGLVNACKNRELSLRISLSSTILLVSRSGGLVYGQCYSRKRFIDFRSFVEMIVVPEAKLRGIQTIALVLDNGPTHASKQLPQWTKKLARGSEGKLTMQLYWLPTNAS